jgi:hypothetical protein
LFAHEVIELLAYSRIGKLAPWLIGLLAYWHICLSGLARLAPMLKLQRKRKF